MQEVEPSIDNMLMSFTVTLTDFWQIVRAKCLRIWLEMLPSIETVNTAAAE